MITLNGNPYKWLPLCQLASEEIRLRKLKMVRGPTSDNISSEVLSVLEDLVSSVAYRAENESRVVPPPHVNNSDLNEVDVGYDDAESHNQEETPDEAPYNLLESLESHDSELTPEVPSALIISHVRRLQCEESLSSNVEVEVIYSDLNKHLQDEATLQILLVCLHEARGGLYLIASGLLHVNPSVRHNSFLILQRIQFYDSTRQAFESLNAFFHKAFTRQKRRFEDGSSYRDAMQHELRQQMIRSQKNAFRDRRPINKL